MPARRPTPIQLVTGVLLGGATALILWVVVRPSLGFGADLALAAGGLAVLYGPALAAAWVIRSHAGLRRLDLVVITGMVGISAIALGGFVLNILPFGLARGSWLGLAAVLLLGAVAIEGRIPAIRRPSWHGGPARRDMVMLGGAALLVVVALAIGRAGVQPSPESFSSLWIHRTPGGAAEIGVENHEGQVTTYRVDVTVDGQLAAQYQSFTLDNDQDWSTVVPVTVVSGSEMQVVLYDAARPTVPYRNVTMTGPINGQAASLPGS